MSIRHRTRLFLLALVAAAGIGCAAPAPESIPAAPPASERAEGVKPGAAAPTRSSDRTVTRDATRGTDTAPERAPPMSDPLPPQRVEAPAAGGPVTVDRSCRTDADCTVKNVGNCCGYFPACVNVKSPTDPQGVQAQCAKEGMSSVCGFEEIRGCQCVNGQCENANPSRLIQ